MNIFVLDLHPVVAARMQHDMHVIKMANESVQMLSTALSVHAGSWAIMKPTHLHHPCNVWARETRSNWEWLKAHALALCDEYAHRWPGRRRVFHDALEALDGASIPPGSLTPFVLAMPEIYRTACPVASYQAYYAAEKMLPAGRLARWTNRGMPEFLFPNTGAFALAS